MEPKVDEENTVVMPYNEWWEMDHEIRMQKSLLASQTKMIQKMNRELVALRKLVKVYL